MLIRIQHSWKPVVAAYGAGLLLLAATTAARAVEPDTPPATKQAEQQKKPNPKITVSKETTFVEGPLADDGYVDYVKALREKCKAGVTSDNNVAVAMWQAFGPRELIRDEKYREQFWAELGIEPLPEKGDYLVSLSEIAEQTAAGANPPLNVPELRAQLDEQQGEATSRPWSRDDYPFLAKWIEANEKPLAPLCEAIVTRDRFYTPILAGGSDDPASGMVLAVLLPTAQNSREIARLLCTRAMFRLKAGDLDGAWNDLFVTHRLSRHISASPTLIEALISYAIAGMACHSTATLAQESHLMVGQAARYRAQLEKLPPLPRVADCLDTERLTFLDCAVVIARGNDNVLNEIGLGEIGRFIPGASVDWNETVRVGNHWYDRLLIAAREPTYEKRRAAGNEIEVDLTKLAASAKDPAALAKKLFRSITSPRKAIGRQMGDILISLLLPAVQACLTAEDRVATTVDMSRLALALAEYRADRGEYPARLVDLVPKFIPELPQDLFVASDFRSVRGDKGYLLYSVGPNETDDAGKGPFTNFVPNDGDDYAIGTPDMLPKPGE